MNVSQSNSSLVVCCKTGRPVGLQTAHLNSSYLNLLVKDQRQCKCPMCCRRIWQRGKMTQFWLWWGKKGTFRCTSSMRVHLRKQSILNTVYVRYKKYVHKNVWVCVGVYECARERERVKTLYMPLLMCWKQPLFIHLLQLLYSLFSSAYPVSLWGQHNLKSRTTFLIHGHLSLSLFFIHSFLFKGSVCLW